MSTHIQRKKEEYEFINGNLITLRAFIFGGTGSKNDNSKFMSLGNETRDLLLKQYAGMSIYRDSLVEQLALFDVSVN